MPRGLSARSSVAHLDEPIYPAQATLPQESDQLRLHYHSATSPLGLSTRSHVAHLEEFVYSGQVTLPKESDQLRLHCHSASMPGAGLLTLTSSSTLDRSRYLRSQISSGYIATRLHRHSASAPGAQLLTLTSPSLQLRRTGSSLLFVLMSSSSNLDGRAPTIHSDEPFTATQMDGLLPIIRIDELFPQLRWTSSHNSYWRALPSTQMDELLLFIHIGELFPSIQMGELPLHTLTSPSLQLRRTGSSLLFVLMSSSPKLRWTSSHCTL